MSEVQKPLFNADAAEEYLTSLAVYYRNTANAIFERDNEGRHASEQIYSAEYQKYVGMQIAMREVLEYFGKYELTGAETGSCEGCRWRERHQKCSCCRRNKYLKDCYEEGHEQ